MMSLGDVMAGIGATFGSTGKAFLQLQPYDKLTSMILQQNLAFNTLVVVKRLLYSFTYSNQCHDSMEKPQFKRLQNLEDHRHKIWNTLEPLFSQTKQNVECCSLMP